MNWIEQLLHLDPDAGSGLAELAVAVVLAAAVALAAVGRRRLRAGVRRRIDE